MKNIKNILKYYIGCTGVRSEDDSHIDFSRTYKLCALGTVDDREWSFITPVEKHPSKQAEPCSIDNFKPLLRKVTTMNEEELRELLFLGIRTYQDMEVDISFELLDFQRINNQRYKAGEVFHIKSKNGTYLGSDVLSLLNFNSDQFLWLTENKFDVFELIKQGKAFDLDIVKQEVLN